MSYKVVFILGGPGCGKGTMCAKIVEVFHYAHLSAGDLLREEQKDPNSSLGAQIAHHMVSGTIVPAEVTCSLLGKAMDKLWREKHVQHFLIDGFPRNQDNMNGWRKHLQSKCEVQFVIYFSCPDEICIARCQQRGLTSGRLDDNIETLNRRLKQFKNECLPVIEQFRKQGLLREINSNATLDEVFANVQPLFR